MITRLNKVKNGTKIKKKNIHNILINAEEFHSLKTLKQKFFERKYYFRSFHWQYRLDGAIKVLVISSRGEGGREKFSSNRWVRFILQAL